MQIAKNNVVSFTPHDSDKVIAYKLVDGTKWMATPVIGWAVVAGEWDSYDRMTTSIQPVAMFEGAPMIVRDVMVNENVDDSTVHITTHWMYELLAEQ